MAIVLVNRNSSDELGNVTKLGSLHVLHDSVFVNYGNGFMIKLFDAESSNISIVFPKQPHTTLKRNIRKLNSLVSKKHVRFVV